MSRIEIKENREIKETSEKNADTKNGSAEASVCKSSSRLIAMNEDDDPTREQDMKLARAFMELSFKQLVSSLDPDFEVALIMDHDLKALLKKAWSIGLLTSDRLKYSIFKDPFNLKVFLNDSIVKTLLETSDMSYNREENFLELLRSIDFKEENEMEVSYASLGC